MAHVIYLGYVWRKVGTVQYVNIACQEHNGTIYQLRTECANPENHPLYSSMAFRSTVEMAADLSQPAVVLAVANTPAVILSNPAPIIAPMNGPLSFVIEKVIGPNEFIQSTMNGAIAMKYTHTGATGQ